MVKRLFFDRYHVACRGDIWHYKGNCEFINGPIEKIGPFFRPEKPWEKACINWLSLKFDQGKWRLWYECFASAVDDYGSMLCYAESDDLVNWVRPDLGICEFEGNKNNNIIIDAKMTDGMGFHGHSIYIDPNAPDFARYRCLFLGALPYPVDDWKQGFITFAFSADGIHWTFGAPEVPKDYNHLPLTAFGSDTQNIAFWDIKRHKYIGYFRALSHNGCRSINRAESNDGIHWTYPETVLEPDMYDDLNTDYYNNAATAVYEEGEEAHYIFYSAYCHTTDTLCIKVATSRDGVHYDRYVRDAFINNDSEFDNGGMYATNGILNLPDGRQAVAYNGVTRHHDAPMEENFGDGNYMLAVFEKDRIQGMRVKDHFEFPVCGVVDPNHPEVTVNADIRGSIRGGLIDPKTWQYLPGFTPEDCEPLTGNGTNLVMRWKGAPTNIEKAELKLFVDDADLYACTVNAER